MQPAISLLYCRKRRKEEEEGGRKGRGRRELRVLVSQKWYQIHSVQQRDSMHTTYPTVQYSSWDSEDTAGVEVEEEGPRRRRRRNDFSASLRIPSQLIYTSFSKNKMIVTMKWEV